MKLIIITLAVIFSFIMACDMGPRFDEEQYRFYLKADTIPVNHAIEPIPTAQFHFDSSLILKSIGSSQSFQEGFVTEIPKPILLQNNNGTWWVLITQGGRVINSYPSDTLPYFKNYFIIFSNKGSKQEEKCWERIHYVEALIPNVNK